MKIYSTYELMKNEKREVYRNLRKIGFSEYESRKTLLEVYSLKGELLFKPLRLGMMIWLKRKNWLEKQEFENCLERLVS
jgi:hypothetical protein